MGRAVPELRDVLRSRPTILRGALKHVYVENEILRMSEEDAVGRLWERPAMGDEMRNLLQEIEDTFIDGYNPETFVHELISLKGLDSDQRDRLLASLRREYQGKFRPLDRLKDFRRSAGDFLSAYCKWRDHVLASGRDPASARLWEVVGEAASALQDLLGDPELSTRWIP